MFSRTLKFKNIITSIGKDTEELEPSHIAGENIKWLSHFGKTDWQFFKMLNPELPYDPVPSL